MSKWLDKFKERNKKVIRKRIEKLTEEREEYRLNYNDFPWERYRKAWESRDAEIEELKRELNGTDALELQDYKEELKRMRGLMSKINKLTTTLEPSDKRSDENIKKLLSMTGSYAGEHFDSDFDARCESGVW